MPQLRIERVPIRDLQVSGFDHLHLVLEPDRVENSTYPQDEWLGIEGTFSGPLNNATLRTLGGNGTTTLPELNQGQTGTDLQAAIGTPGERGSRVLSVAGDLFVAWNFMAALARDLDEQKLPYQAQVIASRYTFNINSSSVAVTLLYSIGIEIVNNLPYGVGRSNGWQTLLGTSGDDTITDFSVDDFGWWWFTSQDDTLALDISGVTTVSDVLDYASEANGNLILDFGSGDRLTLQDMRLSQLEEADIQFI